MKPLIHSKYLLKAASKRTCLPYQYFRGKEVKPSTLVFQEENKSFLKHKFITEHNI